jgi:adenylate kinase
MRLIFIGPPGSGKGTQAKLLSQRLGLRHFSTGDILREAILRQTPEGRLASPYVSTGRLVPDEIVNEIINARFRAKDRPECFVMDGYPRTVPQADSFDQALRAHGMGLDAVISLKVDDDEIVRRLGGRWNCPNPRCGATYHTVFKPPRRPGVCDVCGTPLMQRDDDKPETVVKRLQIFHALYAELLEDYRKRGLLVEVPGVGDIETIYAAILRALEARKAKLKSAGSPCAERSE